MRSRRTQQEQALAKLRSVAEGLADQPASEAVRAQLAQAISDVFVGALAEGLREAAASRATPAPQTSTQPQQGGQLHHQLLLTVEAAEAAGARPEHVVDELCWALASYAHTRELHPKAVRGTLATVQGLLARSGPLA
jgi:hypothetical protein